MHTPAHNPAGAAAWLDSVRIQPESAVFILSAVRPSAGVYVYRPTLGQTEHRPAAHDADGAEERDEKAM